MLFDYLESIETSEIRRIFSRIFRVTAAIVLLAGSALGIISSGSNPALLQHYESYLIVLIFSGILFLVWFHMDYRIITGLKASRRSRRRDKFVRNIEDDFRSHLKGTGCVNA